MVLVSHPTGNQCFRQVALATLEAGLLSELQTAFSWNVTHPVHRWLPGKIRSELARRSYREELRPFLRNQPWRELGRLISQSLLFDSLTRHERGVFSVDAVYRSFDRHVARRITQADGLRAVYAFEDGAAHTFAAAVESGLIRFYDLPIGYWRAARELFREEAQRQPEWAGTLSGNLDSDEKLARKDEELRLASHIYVASSFTRKTLATFPDLQAPVHVIPYGAPEVNGPKTWETSTRPLKVIYVGSLTQRKGVSYFLEACQAMGRSIEVTIVGRKAGECRPLEEALKTYRWIPSLPHHAILEEMRRNDVLVFPSLFEGFGLVILEAMAQGLPVITTDHTAGPEIIEHGVDGYLVPIRSSEAIVEKLTELARQPALLRDLSEAARRKAEYLSWPRFRGELARSFHHALEPAAKSLAHG